MLSEYKGHHCQHRSDDFPTIAKIIGEHKPLHVVELGTDEGGFSGFLADLVKPWGGRVFTFDITAKFKPSLLADFDNLQYVEKDVLTPRLCIQGTLDNNHALLYCDNGNKPREVELYAKWLRPGSLLGVHDYNTEIMADWVEPYVAKLGFEPAGHELMEALRNEWYPEPMTRFWVRREVP